MHMCLDPWYYNTWFGAFSNKLPHRAIPVSRFVESVSAPIVRLLLPTDLEQKRNITHEKKFQLLTDESEKKERKKNRRRKGY